jgi:hypothetical protein
MLLILWTLYTFHSITTANGNGFEAFFNVDGVLVISISIKKEHHTLALSDHPITDSRWHSVTVSHSHGKKPFGSSYVTVYIDGKEQKVTALKFPPLNEVCSLYSFFYLFNSHFYSLYVVWPFDYKGQQRSIPKSLYMCNISHY